METTAAPARSDSELSQLGQADARDRPQCVLTLLRGPCGMIGRTQVWCGYTNLIACLHTLRAAALNRQTRDKREAGAAHRLPRLQEQRRVPLPS